MRKRTKMKIKAKGEKYGRQLTITISKKDDEYFYDVEGCKEKEKVIFISGIQYELSQRYLFAGTYTPKRDEEDINFLNVLTNYYFDDTPEIDAEGIEPMPHEKGVIY